MAGAGGRSPGRDLRRTGRGRAEVRTVAAAGDLPGRRRGPQPHHHPTGLARHRRRRSEVTAAVPGAHDARRACARPRGVPGIGEQGWRGVSIRSMPCSRPGRFGGPRPRRT